MVVFVSDSIDFKRITLAIEAFEKSKQVNKFSSKYDYFITGKVELTPQEMRGLNVFVNSAKRKLCILPPFRARCYLQQSITNRFFLR